MILIADSGSTKTAWCVIDYEGNEHYCETSGLNPYHQSEEEISVELSTALVPQLPNTEIHHIYFYGAGCGVTDKQELMQRCFKRIFPLADSQVASDLLGAARALFQHQSGIASIMGTGSNSGLYDGKDIVANVSAGGYILGDEGSGAVLGKLFASDYLKNQLPQAVRTAFEKEYNLTAATLIEHVYRRPFPNRYLAQFTRFMHAHLEEACVYNLVFDGFDAFVRRNLVQYPDFQKLPLGFVGSIAHHFRDVLEVVLQEHHLTLGSIVKSPLEGMVKYHKSELEQVKKS